MLVDSRVEGVEQAVVGAGIRAAKLVLPGAALCRMPGVEVIGGLANPV